MESIMYVLKYTASEITRHGKIGDWYVAIDQASGGYPYPVELHRAHFFSTKVNAEQYSSHFKGQFILGEVELVWTEA